jgi:hypothetical protein
MSDGLRNSLLFVGIGAIVVIAGAVMISRDPAPEAGAASENKNMSSTLTLNTSAFEQGQTIPSKYTCDGDNVSPPLSFGGVPEGTKTLALIMDDPDVPKQLKPDGVFDHWTLFNITPDTREIPENGSAGTAGANGAGKSAYTGPCPPAQYEPSEHRYFFRLYALDGELDLPAGASKNDVLTAMEGHIISEVELMGRYKRK